MARLNTRPSYASSRYTSATPGPDNASDQENSDPRAGGMDKGKGRAGDPPSRTSLPTPTSDGSGDARGQKRKRVEVRAGIHEEEDDEKEAERKFNQYFDPNQDTEERREVKRKSRALERDFQGMLYNH